MSGAHASSSPPPDPPEPPEPPEARQPEPDQAQRSISTGPPRLTPLRELQLLEAFRAGDATAASELLGGYQRRIYSICYRMVRDREDAADLTQDVLVKVLEGLDRYDGRAKLSTWVYRIAMNASLSLLRKQKVRRARSLDAPGEREGAPSARERPDSREPPAGQRVERRETVEAVSRALGAMDPDARALLVLRDFQEMDYQQISEVLEIPVGTVKSRLFRARLALREAARLELETRRPADSA